MTAPKIDPGFTGVITLEMANHGSLPIELRAETDAPAQLMLFQLTRPLQENQIYGSAEGDVFQYQSEPIPRRGKLGRDPAGAPGPHSFEAAAHSL